MHLEETPAAKEWLLQFDAVDRQIARQMLRRLVLVSTSDFEQRLQSLICSIVDQAPKENFALLSVPEPPPSFDDAGTRRIPGSSADRVKHILENLGRLYGPRVRPNPTIDSMRAERIRNILLVEDLVGSGNRITGYWKEQANKSIKSWISYGWTKLWVCAYAAMDEGRRAILRRLPVDAARLQTVVPERHPRLTLTEPMRWVAEKYGRKLRGDAWWGYSGGGSNLIFQHGCPNNAPAILWVSTSRFKALFPDRGVPPALQSSFGAFNALAAAEDLWDFRQYRLALSILHRIASGRGASAEIKLAIALGLAASYGRWDDARLQTQLMLPIGEIAALRSSAYRLGLIDTSDHRLTPFGRDALTQLRRHPHGRSRKATALPKLSDLYYPQSCGGVVQH